MSGPQGLQDVLSDDDLRTKLMKFLEERLAEECLLFYESVERFENLTSQDSRNEMGAEIVKNFIIEDSLYWINISASTRDVILALETFSPEAFSMAKAEVYRLMSTNFFHEFKREIGLDEQPVEVTTFSREGSFRSVFVALGKLNAKQESFEIDGCTCSAEDIESGNICKIRKDFIKSKLKETIPNETGHHMKLTNVLRGRLRRGTKGSSDSFGHTRAQRTKNAIKRIFSPRKKSRKRIMSFWDKFE